MTCLHTACQPACCYLAGAILCSHSFFRSIVVLLLIIVAVVIMVVIFSCHFQCSWCCYCCYRSSILNNTVLSVLVAVPMVSGRQALEHGQDQDMHDLGGGIW